MKGNRKERREGKKQETKGGRKGGKIREIKKRDSKYFFKKEKLHIINNIEKWFW